MLGLFSGKAFDRGSIGSTRNKTPKKKGDEMDTLSANFEEGVTSVEDDDGDNENPKASSSTSIEAVHEKGW